MFFKFALSLHQSVMRGAYYLAAIARWSRLIPIGSNRYSPIRPGDVLLSIMGFTVAFYIYVLLCIIVFFAASLKTFLFVLSLAPFALFLLTSVLCLCYLDHALQETLARMSKEELWLYEHLNRK
jgi:hypothetical protein